MARIDDYMAGLAEEGYRPSLDDDGDVAFKHQGTGFFLQCRQPDEDYVRLVLGYALDDGMTEDVVLRAGNDANASMKAAKTSVSYERRGVEFSIEAFYREADHFQAFLSRLLGILEASSDYFFERARAEKAVHGAA